MQNFNETFNQLNKDELIHFMKAYNGYIVEFYEDHDSESVPVCMSEFYHTDYKLYY